MRRRPMAVILATADAWARVKFRDPLLAIEFGLQAAELPEVEELWVVDLLRASPPNHSLEKPYGSLWCPYCRAWQRFDDDHYLGYAFCRVCGISDADYHVKLSNRLGDSGAGKRYDSPEEEKKAVKRANRRARRKFKEKTK